VIASHSRVSAERAFSSYVSMQTIRRSLTPEATRALVQASAWTTVILFWSAVAEIQLRRLQSVQNAAVRLIRLISGVCCYDHITPVLATLHCLSIRQRVIF